LPGSQNVADVVIQASGRIVVAGTSLGYPSTEYDFLLAGYTLQGVLDTTFGGDGIVTTNFSPSSEDPSWDAAYALAIQADDKLVAGGLVFASTGQQFGLARYLSSSDPHGSFVTGDGWFASPAGAYAANPALTGRVSFGFVSKYQMGASVPTGNTEFQFKAGNLTFKSTSYQWLVVAGARAQFKGTGTINGAGTYEFLLTAVDGQAGGGGGTDKFRIKITGAGGGPALYDTQRGAADSAAPTTALGGGQIEIRSDPKAASGETVVPAVYLPLVNQGAPAASAASSVMPSTSPAQPLTPPDAFPRRHCVAAGCPPLIAP
jgi:uncharacterized delta-60 repeat protein